MLQSLHPQHKKDESSGNKCAKCLCDNKNCDNHPKAVKTEEMRRDEVADNVMDYICMKEGGHFQYGWGYISAQASNILHDDKDQ